MLTMEEEEKEENDGGEPIDYEAAMLAMQEAVTDYDEYQAVVEEGDDQELAVDEVVSVTQEAAEDGKADAMVEEVVRAVEEVA